MRQKVKKLWSCNLVHSLAFWCKIWSTKSMNKKKLLFVFGGFWNLSSDLPTWLFIFITLRVGSYVFFFFFYNVAACCLSVQRFSVSVSAAVWLQNDDAKYVKLLHGKWMHWPFLPLLILNEEVVSLTPLVDTAFRINILLFLPSLGSDTHNCLVWCMHRLCGSIRICRGLNLALTLELDT